MTLDSMDTGQILYESELRAMESAIGKRGYHITGWNVTTVSTLTVTLNAGAGVAGGGVFKKTTIDTDVIISASDPTYDRIDIIFYDASLNVLAKKDGSPGLDPNPPDPDDPNDIVLYRVHVRSGVTSITTNDIYDVRGTKSEPIIRENRSHYNGVLSRWYSDDGTTLKAEIDGSTGNSKFGPLTILSSLVSSTQDFKVAKNTPKIIADAGASTDPTFLLQEISGDKGSFKYNTSINAIEIAGVDNDDIYIRPSGTGNGVIDAPQFSPYAGNTTDLGNDTEYFKTLYYCNTTDKTCAYLGDYSDKELYNMFKQIGPYKNGTKHNSPMTKRDIEFPHIDFSTLPDEFASLATKKHKILGNVFEKGDKAGIDRGVWLDALTALVIKMYEKLMTTRNQYEG